MSEHYGDLHASDGASAAQRLVVAAVAAHVPAGGHVLDVGCSTGHVAGAIAARGVQVTGVEPDPVAAERARAVCDEVITGGIDDAAIRARLPRGVDVVVFADVLEHLTDPTETLRFVRELLTPEGVVVTSIPNIAHWSARREVARGRFPATDHGLFDRTHLRFFTRATARELATGAGYDVIAEVPAPGALPLERLARARAGGTDNEPAPSVARLRAALTRARPELFALQFVFTLTSRR
jgi:2-polyprenyl-3-methyl-5-hydroxy-6-metoxy-1,4-benzoquinol methylase